jgi:hypothetical protein
MSRRTRASVEQKCYDAKIPRQLAHDGQRHECQTKEYYNDFINNVEVKQLCFAVIMPLGIAFYL